MECMPSAARSPLPTATKGHYAVVDAVVEGMKLADSAIMTEARGLIEGSNRRPGDIFSKAAVAGRDAAMDVNIGSASDPEELPGLARANNAELNRAPASLAPNGRTLT